MSSLPAYLIFLGCNMPNAGERFSEKMRDQTQARLRAYVERDRNRLLSARKGESPFNAVANSAKVSGRRKRYSDRVRNDNISRIRRYLEEDAAQRTRSVQATLSIPFKRRSERLEEQARKVRRLLEEDSIVSRRAQEESSDDDEDDADGVEFVWRPMDLTKIKMNVKKTWSDLPKEIVSDILKRCTYQAFVTMRRCNSIYEQEAKRIELYDQHKQILFVDYIKIRRNRVRISGGVVKQGLRRLPIDVMMTNVFRRMVPTQRLALIDPCEHLITTQWDPYFGGLDVRQLANTYPEIGQLYIQAQGNDAVELAYYAHLLKAKSFSIGSRDIPSNFFNSLEVFNPTTNLAALVLRDLAPGDKDLVQCKLRRAIYGYPNGTVAPHNVNFCVFNNHLLEELYLRTDKDVDDYYYDDPLTTIPQRNITVVINKGRCDLIKSHQRRELQQLVFNFDDQLFRIDMPIANGMKRIYAYVQRGELYFMSVPLVIPVDYIEVMKRINANIHNCRKKLSLKD